MGIGGDQDQHQCPLRDDDRRPVNPSKRGNRETPNRDTEYERRDDDREGKVTRTERQRADTVESRLERHHRKTGEQRGSRERDAGVCIQGSSSAPGTESCESTAADSRRGPTLTQTAQRDEDAADSRRSRGPSRLHSR